VEGRGDQRRGEEGYGKEGVLEGLCGSHAGLRVRVEEATDEGLGGLAHVPPFFLVELAVREGEERRREEKRKGEERRGEERR